MRPSGRRLNRCSGGAAGRGGLGADRHAEGGVDRERPFRGGADATASASRHRYPLRVGLPLDSTAAMLIYHPNGWYGDVEGMAEPVHALRPRVGSDTEKITINLGYVDLGHIDLLVQDGFYSNRTDFIRTAIRNQIERHAEATRQSVARKSLDLGIRHFTREDLEAARAAGQRLDIRVLGLASIATDVTAELARATIASISVLGALQASAAVKAALADRTR